MHDLRANTVATLLIGPFVATADGFTKDTNVSLAAGNASAVIGKHNADTLATISNHTLNHERMGMYTLALTTGDTDTLGRFTVFISNPASYLPVWHEYMVVNENAYDAKYTSGGDNYNLNAQVWIPGAAPASNCSLASAIAFHYAMLRNQTVTSSTQLALRNHSDTATVCTATLSDDGTWFTKKHFK